MKVVLYPEVLVKGQDFTKDKVIVVPNQSMSLRDIINRFIRKESLPVSHEGVYIEGLGDLEKMSREDITVRLEKAAQIEQWISREYPKFEESQKPKAEGDAASQKPGPKGPVTGASVGGEAPPPVPTPKE